MGFSHTFSLLIVVYSYGDIIYFICTVIIFCDSYCVMTCCHYDVFIVTYLIACCHCYLHGSHRPGKSRGILNFDIKSRKSQSIFIACQICIQLMVTAVF